MITDREGGYEFERIVILCVKIEKKITEHCVKLCPSIRNYLLRRIYIQLPVLVSPYVRNLTIMFSFRINGSKFKNSFFGHY